MIEDMVNDLRKAKRAIDLRKNPELEKLGGYAPELNIDLNLQHHRVKAGKGQEEPKKKKRGRKMVLPTGRNKSQSKRRTIRLPENTFIGIKDKWGAFIVEWTETSLDVFLLLEDIELIELYSEVLGYFPCSRYYDNGLNMDVFEWRKDNPGKNLEGIKRRLISPLSEPEVVKKKRGQPKKKKLPKRNANVLPLPAVIRKNGKKQKARQA